MGEQIRRQLPHLTEEDARELARILRRLIDALHPEEIHLFGSQARGDVAPHSDVDLLIVVPREDEREHRLAEAAYHAMGPRKLAVDVVVMGREEFERRARAAASLPAVVLREGKLLYRRAGGAHASRALVPRSGVLPRGVVGETTPEALQEGLDWLTRGERDVLSDENCLSGTEAFAAHAAFHAQEGATRGLRAFLAAHDRPFRKTDGLVRLVEACREIDPEFARFASAAQVLEPYGMEILYPGGPPEPSVPEAAEAVRLAAEIVRFVRARLLPDG